MKYTIEKPADFSFPLNLSQFGDRLGILLELCKIKLSLTVAISAATGFVFFAGQFTIDMISPVLGVFLLACGCCGLNQIQEKNSDARMQRTSHRPLPSGRLDSASALTVSLVLCLGGFWMLSTNAIDGPYLTALGLLALLWYNGLYTFLKKVTVFASVIGAPLGMIPPIIGWLAAGGSIFAGRLWILALFFFLWQIPHFWFLLLMRSDEYQQAGFRSITEFLTPAQLYRICQGGIIAVVVAGVTLPLTADMNWTSDIMIGVCSGWLILRTLNISFRHIPPPSKELFRSSFFALNLYAFFMMIAICLNALNL